MIQCRHALIRFIRYCAVLVVKIIQKFESMRLCCLIFARSFHGLLQIDFNFARSEIGFENAFLRDRPDFRNSVISTFV